MKSLFVVTFLFFFASTSFGKLDSSSDVFFPKNLGSKLQTYQATPLSWWNFVLFDSEKVSRDQACKTLAPLKGYILFNSCNEIPFSKEWLKSMGQYQLLSSAPPKNEGELKSQLDKAILQLSLPLSKGSLEVVRNAPLTDFSKLGDQFNQFFESSKSQTRWKIIPLLLNFPPGTNEETLNKFKNSEEINIVGPHFGALENKKIIIQDLKMVVGLGGLLVSILLIWLFTTGRRPYLLLLPIIGISMGLAFLVTTLVFGSIHGLTLAFGGGLVGISMDYAFHGWQKKYDPRVWRSIFVGFLTSFSAFLLLVFFSAPLIRQLSIFSMTGLSCSFLGIWLLSKKGFFESSLRPLELDVPKTPKVATISLLSMLAIFGLSSSLFINNDFSLRSMDVTMSKMETSIRTLNESKGQWHFIFSNKGSKSEVSDLSTWAKENNLPTLNFSSFGNQSDMKTENWKPLLCDPSSFWNQMAAKAPYKNLFKGFFKSHSCQSLEGSIRSPLVELFSSPSKYISILKSENEIEAKKIVEQFPNQFQLSEITKNFPKVLKSEISKFLILIVFLSFIILTYFFGNKSALVLLPSLGGFSSILVVHFIFGFNLSFISFVSMIILIGLTIDYGVFCVSHLKWKAPLAKANGAIALSAMTSLAGFSPLAFCDHPVLRDLGITLTCGLIGALVVCFFLYPHLDKRAHA